jgi:YebC/PmpR family DNA-binding regulatory protein
MSGHSKWATIRRSKAANDAKRGKLFTKVGHEIAVAVREGGPDPEANVSLRMALDKARKANMPKDNITRAIKRGTGELRDQGEIVEAYYEGYGPHGTAIMVKTVTDNRNRAVSEIRHVFSRHGGNLGSEGCVAWMFSQKGRIEIEPGAEDPEEIALIAIDSGAEDVEIGEDLVEVYTEVADFKKVQTALAEGYELANSELAWIPQSTTAPGEKETIQTMKLIEALEDLDDVQQVYSNLEISDDVVAKYEQQAA